MSGIQSGPVVHQETETVRQIDRNAELPARDGRPVARSPVDLSVMLAGVPLRSPIVSASGCFGSGREVSEFFDLRHLGAVTVKSMTLEPWQGKPTPRMVETPSGMLNAIGLQNKGVEYFLQYDLRWLNSAKVPVIASIAGNTKEEFVRVAGRLRGAPGVIAIEANISCPNLEDRNNMFSHDPKATHAVISAIRRELDVPLFAKLSPNVTSITEIAAAAVDAGAGRRRRRGGLKPHQHGGRDGNRRRDRPSRAGRCDGRPVRARHPPHRGPGGLRGAPGVPGHPDHRDGGRHERP